MEKTRTQILREDMERYANDSDGNLVCPLDSEKARALIDARDNPESALDNVRRARMISEALRFNPRDARVANSFEDYLLEQYRDYRKVA